jgi:hypothetical protein
MLKNIFFVFLFLTSSFLKAEGSSNNIAGTYKTILYHEATKFYQVANILLRTIQLGNGQMKISANVKIFFGDSTSSEFLTYEFDECPMNLLTRQISIKDPKANVSLVGTLKNKTLQGEWYSSVVGKVGKFEAIKDTEPKPPTDGILIKSLTGHYKGDVENTNPDSNLPERMTMSIITTQDTTGPEPVVKLSGSVRLYVGDYGSIEYEETKLTDIQFNFYNRYFSAKTDRFGLTYKGIVSKEGDFSGLVFADGVGEVGKFKIKKM